MLKLGAILALSLFLVLFATDIVRFNGFEEYMAHGIGIVILNTSIDFVKGWLVLLLFFIIDKVQEMFHKEVVDE